MSTYVLFTESSPNLGGQELQLLQQMQQLERLKFKPVLACRQNSRVASLAMDKGLSFFYVPFRNSVHPASILKVRNWIARHTPVLAICHSGHDSNVLAIAARLTLQRPFILRSRTYQPGNPSAWSYNHLVDATMLPSQYLKGVLLENSAIDPNRLHVVYPGIDFGHIDAVKQHPLPDHLEAWLSAHPGPMVVQAAMLRGEKGHQTMLYALSKLISIFPSVRYVIAGEGPEEGRIRQRIAELGLTDHVFVAGMVQPVAALIVRADLLVMPSSYEPLGMAQIEALSLGVPVIASATGGIPETVIAGKTGILLAPEDKEAWYAALAEALSHLEHMREMALIGRADVRERFSVNQNSAAILKIAGLDGFM